MYKTRLSLSAAFTAILLATLACGFSASTAKITDAYLAFDEGGTQKTTAYTPTDKFFVIVELANAPDDTVTKAVWTGVELANGEKNVKLLENEFTSGNKKIYFTASGDWAVGKYKVDIYLNDKLDRTLEFEVAAKEGAPPSSTASGLIKNAYLSSDEAGQQETSVFGVSDTIYANIDAQDAPADIQIRADWYVVEAAGVEPNSFIDQAETIGTGTFTFNLSPANPWPIGKYRVEIYVNGELAITMEYEIQ